jgi:hypothetical protein
MDHDVTLELIPAAIGHVGVDGVHFLFCAPPNRSAVANAGRFGRMIATHM